MLHNQKIFIAIPIVDQLQMFAIMQSYFARMLNPKISPAQCVAARNLHVTIAYIGEVNKEDILSIQLAVRDATMQYALLKKPAKLLWRGDISLYNNAIALTFAYDKGLILQANMIRNRLTQQGISFDERFDFRAHATIARIKPNNMIEKGIKRIVLEVINQKNAFELNPIVVTQVGMYESGCIEPFRTFDCT